MKKLIILGFLTFVAVAGWRIAERLSPDALGMLLGVVFGILAGAPAALLVLASSRRRDESPDESRMMVRSRGTPYGSEYAGLPQHAPVIILAGNGMPVQMAGQQQTMYAEPQARYALPAVADASSPRHFKVVGEKEEWVEDD
jgi:hypothetical protein